MFEVLVVVGLQENYHTSECDTYGRQSKEEAVAAKIGDSCQEYGQPESSDSGRNRVKLCPDLTVSICFDNGGIKMCKVCKDAR